MLDLQKEITKSSFKKKEPLKLFTNCTAKKSCAARQKEKQVKKQLHT